MAHPPHQQYADLAEDAYESRQVTKESEKGINIAGNQYKVLAVANDRSSGYQGTVYQDLRTNAIIIAHRGTESLGDDWKDTVADLNMVLRRGNGQAQAAVDLTKVAMAQIKRIHAEDPSKPMPTLTHTGHSLGGTLAQICAHYFNHGGVTFNAYGAASIGRIPEGMAKGGANVVNYVKASDPAAAASPHYGQTVVLAAKDDTARLAAAGYTNNQLLNAAMLVNPALAVSRPASAAAFSVGPAHGIANFTGAQSLLADPEARTHAEENRVMIDAYRSHVRTARQALGLADNIVIPVMNAPEIINMLQPARPTGEPAEKNLRPLTQTDTVSDMPANQFFESKTAQQPQAPSSGPFNDPFLDRYYAAILAGDSQQADKVALDFAQSAQGLELAQQGQQLLAAQQQQEQQAQMQHAPVMKM